MNSRKPLRLLCAQYRWRFGKIRLFPSPKRILLTLVSALLIGIVPAQDSGQPEASRGCTATPVLDSEGFRSVMQTVANGWNRGDARMAASCFAENAVYSGPHPLHLAAVRRCMRGLEELKCGNCRCIWRGITWCSRFPNGL